MRTAVIVVGISNYNERILNEVIRCYSLNDKNVDVFIYNNNTFEDNEKIKKYFNDNNINVIINKSNKYSPVDKTDIASNINSSINDKIKHNWQKFKDECTNSNIINNSNISRHVPFRGIGFFSPFLHSNQQHEQIYLALKEIIKYEDSNDFKYDYIMKIRLDFFLKHDKFGPLHYFNDKNDVLLKSYSNLKYYYDKINEDDNYHPTEFRINNYLYWRTTKFLGGQFMLNKDSYERIVDSLDDREQFNEIIGNQFVITINDACFFSSGSNFKKFMFSLCKSYGEFYSEENHFWWTAESQFLLSILDSGLYYLDYIQNNNYYHGREMWVNDYHGTEKYEKSQMNTSHTFR